MKRGLWILLGVCTGLMGMAGTVQKFYVAPDGDDANSGSWMRPFATFARAQKAVRQFKEQTPPAEIERIEVLFAAGEYSLAEPIRMTPFDGGTERYPVLYRSSAKSRPAVFTGGRKICNGWKVDESGVWRTVIPEVKEGKWNFSQLYVNGVRRYRPRVPATGDFETIDNAEVTKNTIGGFIYRKGDLDPKWANLQDIEFHVLHVWSASRLRASAIDPAAGMVRFTAPRKYNTYWASFKKRRYWAENVKEAFGAPGTWYLDRKTGELSYAPMPGERLEKVTIEAPVLDQLLLFQGMAHEPVRNLRMEGLVFRQCGWNTPLNGNFTPQGEMNIPAAVEVVRTEGVRFERCVITQTGGYAFAFGAGAHSNAVESCLMVDLGAGGVKIGPPCVGYTLVAPPVNPLTPETDAAWARGTSAITIRNCQITHGGRIHPAAHGVWIGHSSYNQILHNEISDLFYTAVAVGWVWGYAEPSRAHHNEIGYNHLHAIGQGVLSDMGGVYTLGVSPGTTVHNNRIHDVHAFDYGGWGLYTDEGSTGIQMCSNLVYDVKTGGFHQHYGRENVIENNIFANSLKDQLQRSRSEKHISFFLRKNIIYWDNDGVLLGKNWADCKRGLKEGKPTQGFELGPNLYWHSSGKKEIFPGKKTLEQWQEMSGQDSGSLVADPLFMDAAKNDFRLRPDSPAFQMGFTPFDPYRDAGVKNGASLPAWESKQSPAPYPVRLEGGEKSR